MRLRREARPRGADHVICDLLVGQALMQIRTLAYVHQQPEPELPIDPGVPVLEQIRRLADAVDGLNGRTPDLAYRSSVWSAWQRRWVNETLEREGLTESFRLDEPTR